MILLNANIKGALLFLLYWVAIYAYGQTADPFTCSPGIYKVNSGQLSILNPVTGNYLPIGDNAGFDYNNLGWNPADNFLYAMSRGFGTDANGLAIDNRDLIKIDADGEVFFVVDTGNANGADAGAVVDGELWVRRSDTLYQAINLTTHVITDHSLSKNVPPLDWTLLGELLFGVDVDDTGQAQLYLLSTNTDTVETSNIIGMSDITGSDTFDGAYTVNSNQLYVNHNSGGLYLIDRYHFGTPTGELVFNTQSINNSDGASCSSAEFPQAILGLAMDATQPIDHGNGTFTSTFTITLENLGNMPFYDLSLTDNFTSSFGTYTSSTPTSPGTYTISSAPSFTSNPSDPLSANASFSGDPAGVYPANHNIILPNVGSIQAEETAVLTIGITFYPTAGRSNFNSQAVVTGDIVNDGKTVEGYVDFSTSGTNSDPDNNNNPVDNSEVTFLNTNEICFNGIDDDGDGLIDCDDGDCNPYFGCVVSGGAGGGLESNDELISKIAAREYERAMSNIDYESKAILSPIERPADYGAFQEIGFRDEFSIDEFIPIGIFPDLETLISTPEDLADITNATEVSAVDMFRGESRLAAVLALKSDGVYEHAKYVCDRVKGAEIRRIFNHKFDGENDFIVTFFKNRYGDAEYTTNFSAYVNEEGAFTLESHWDLDNFDDTRAYYNFQVWANGLQRLDTLTAEVLRLLEAKLPLSAYNFTGAPKVYAKSLHYENEQVVMHLINNAGASQIQVVGSAKVNETSDNSDFSYDLALSGALEETVYVPTGAIYSFGADIIHDENEVADVVYTADGFWGMAFQRDGTEVEEWEVIESIHQDTGVFRQNTSWIERNFKLKASTDKYVTIYRTLNPASRGEDLSAYNTLTFEVEGTGDLEVRILKSNVDRPQDQMKTSYLLDGACKRIYLKRSRFSNIQPWEDIHMISFTQRSLDGKTIDVDLNIGEIAFLHLDGSPPACEAYNPVSAYVYPNPAVGGLINIKLSKPCVTYDIVINNQMGQAVYARAGDVFYDGLLSINHNFNTGIYEYQVTLESEVVTGKFVVYP